MPNFKCKIDLLISTVSKLDSFPKLSDNQVALMRAEFNTGIVLDDKFQYAVNDNQKVFTVFNSQKEAEDAAREILLKRHDIEFVIYGNDKEVLQYITTASK